MGENSRASPSNALQNLVTHVITKFFLMSQPNHSFKKFASFLIPSGESIIFFLTTAFEIFPSLRTIMFLLALLFSVINKPNYFMSSVSLITLVSPPYYNCLTFLTCGTRKRPQRMSKTRYYNQIITRAKLNADLRDHILIYTRRGKKCIFYNNVMLLIYFSVCSAVLLEPFLQNCCFVTYFLHCIDAHDYSSILVISHLFSSILRII